MSQIHKAACINYKESSYSIYDTNKIGDLELYTLSNDSFILKNKGEMFFLYLGEDLSRYWDSELKVSGKDSYHTETSVEILRNSFNSSWVKVVFNQPDFEMILSGELVEEWELEIF